MTSGGSPPATLTRKRVGSDGLIARGALPRDDAIDRVARIFFVQRPALRLEREKGLVIGRLVRPGVAGVVDFDHARLVRRDRPLGREEPEKTGQRGDKQSDFPR